MDDLISRQAAIDALTEYGNGRAVFISVGEAVIRIEQLPPIQSEIVRCKDCKYAEYIDDVQTLWCTECGQGRTVAPNDFCSYGEKERGEQNG